MTTRFNVPDLPDQEQLPNGYDTQNTDPSTYSIPPCGIEDVDVAVHALFDNDIPFKSHQITTGYQKGINIKKPFVKFASGERFALAKSLKPFRDQRTGTLLLPAIAIRRTGIEQQHQDTYFGELVIKRRLDPSADRDYQNLINKSLLLNVPEPPTTLRQNKGSDRNVPSIREGMLLDVNPEKLRADHIYEIIAIPFPQFYTATYEVVYWTSYIQHMNYMIETTLASQVTPGKSYSLKTEKGYWFMANADSALNAQDNFEEITDAERINKYSFNLTVRGYILAPSGPGQRVPFKRYLSSVSVAFETYIAPGDVTEQSAIEKSEGTLVDATLTNPYVLTDLEQDPVTKQAATGQEKIVFQREYRDPTGAVSQTKYVKQMASNQKQGETVYTASDQQALSDFFVDNK